MKYSFEVKNGNVYVSHPGIAVPIVVESWTWHCGALVQLISELEELRALLKAGGQ